MKEKSEMGMVSVIIPAYNVANCLRGCVESVLSQSYQNIEIIIVDDGSTDETPRICDDLLKQYSDTHTIIVIRKENNGVSSARNAGLDAARGDFIVFLDSDDAIVRNFISILVSVITEQNADIAVCGRQKKDSFDCVLSCAGIEWALPYSMLTHTSDEAVCQLLAGRISGSCCERVIRKDVLHKLRFDESIINNEDKLFLFQVYRNAQKICIIDAKLYVQYVRDGSATHVMPVENIDKMRVAEQIVQELSAVSSNKGLIEVAEQHRIEMAVSKLRSLMRYSTCNDTLSSHRKKLFYEIRNNLRHWKKPAKLRSKRTSIELFAINLGYTFYHLFVAVGDALIKHHKDNMGL